MYCLLTSAAFFLISFVMFCRPSFVLCSGKLITAALGVSRVFNGFLGFLILFSLLLDYILSLYYDIIKSEYCTNYHCTICAHLSLYYYIIYYIMDTSRKRSLYTSGVVVSSIKGRGVSACPSLCGRHSGGLFPDLLHLIPLSCQLFVKECFRAPNYCSIKPL